MERKFLITVREITDSVDVSPIHERARFNIKSFLGLRYSVIKARIKNQKKYKGFSICSKEEFFNMSMSCTKLKGLFKAWQDSNFTTRLAPTVNRINPRKGYTIDNIEWMVLHENSSKGRRKK
jgi:hypothetical protein